MSYNLWNFIRFSQQKKKQELSQCWTVVFHICEYEPFTTNSSKLLGHNPHGSSVWIRIKTASFCPNPSLDRAFETPTKFIEKEILKILESHLRQFRMSEFTIFWKEKTCHFNVTWYLKKVKNKALTKWTWICGGSCSPIQCRESSVIKPFFHPTNQPHFKTLR